MAKKLSQNDFIERITEIHGNKYDHSKSIYKNTRTKVILTCPKHGDFEIKPDNLLTGQGCVKCAQDRHKLTTISQERLENIKKIHNNKYIYQNIQVINGQIDIICPTHGKFTQSIYNHEYGHGCSNCDVDSRKIKRYRICKWCNAKKEIINYDKKFRVCKFCIESNTNISSKICTKCNISKSVSEFYVRLSTDRYRNECKECFNKLRIPVRKIYRKKNKKLLITKDISYRKQRLKTDTFFQSKIYARNLIRKALSKGGYSKKSRTEEILGCSYQDFKSHIESLFLPEMNWENRDLWDIDHIIPISFAITEEELLRLNHYSNLRPLWSIDNLSKGDKIETETKVYNDIIENRFMHGYSLKE